MERDEFREMGRVGAGQSLELHQLFDRFHHNDGCAASFQRVAKLIEDLRQYVAREFSTNPTPGEAVEFAKSAAKAMDLPAARLSVGKAWHAYSKALQAGGTSSDDDDGDTNPESEIGGKSKPHRGDRSR